MKAWEGPVRADSPAKADHAEHRTRAAAKLEFLLPASPVPRLAGSLSSPPTPRGADPGELTEIVKGRIHRAGGRRITATQARQTTAVRHTRAAANWPRVFRCRGVPENENVKHLPRAPSPLRNRKLDPA